MRVNLSVICVLSLLICNIDCYRILGVFHMPAPSHYILGSSLMKGLAEKGHDVTVISSYGEKNLPKHWKYRDIVLTGFTEEKDSKMTNLFEVHMNSYVMMTMFMNFMGNDKTEKTLNHPNVQKLLNAKNETFDLVIIEQFVNDALKGFAYHFNCPLVLLSTIGANSWVNPLVGNPANPSYIPEILLNLPKEMNLWERIVNSVWSVLLELNRQFIFFPQQNKILQKYIPGADLNVINYNVSLVLVNSHVSANEPVPFTPNMISIGGYHVKPPKSLPEDLKKFLDNSKNGVVYFSMGSNLKSKDIPPTIRKHLLNSFSKLKENVLWKFEDDSLVDKPANVKIGKWLPQADILAHPNVKVFITHGGLLSTTEALYHGVPIIAIPIFGDQKTNAGQAESSGYGLVLDFTSITEELFSKTIKEILTNPKYKESAKTRSKIMHDNQNSPMDTATFWVEYVIRHKGAPHLRSAALNLRWYQYLLLDVILVICLVFIISSTVLIVIIKKCCKCRKNKVDLEKKKK